MLFDRATRGAFEPYIELTKIQSVRCTCIDILKLEINKKKQQKMKNKNKNTWISVSVCSYVEPTEWWMRSLCCAVCSILFCFVSIILLFLTVEYRLLYSLLGSVQLSTALLCSRVCLCVFSRKIRLLMFQFVISGCLLCIILVYPFYHFVIQTLFPLNFFPSFRIPIRWFILWHSCYYTYTYFQLI